MSILDKCWEGSCACVLAWMRHVGTMETFGKKLTLADSSSFNARDT